MASSLFLTSDHRTLCCRSALVSLVTDPPSLWMVLCKFSGSAKLYPIKNHKKQKIKTQFLESFGSKFFLFSFTEAIYSALVNPIRANSFYIFLLKNVKEKNPARNPAKKVIYYFFIFYVLLLLIKKH